MVPVRTLPVWQSQKGGAPAKKHTHPEMSPPLRAKNKGSASKPPIFLGDQCGCTDTTINHQVLFCMGSYIFLFCIFNSNWDIGVRSSKWIGRGCAFPQFGKSAKGCLSHAGLQGCFCHLHRFCRMPLIEAAHQKDHTISCTSLHIPRLHPSFTGRGSRGAGESRVAGRAVQETSL